MLNSWPYLLPLLAAMACLYVWQQSRTKPAPAPKNADPASLRHTDCGDVVGFADKHKMHDVHAWLGIPYAQPPVGALRWKAPRPPLRWKDTRRALEFGAVAAQPAGITIEAPESEWGKPAGSEDCLTLNIFAPRFEPTQLPQGATRLPVMVWIHGGANTCGTSATYGMVRNLAALDGVIVVSVNYRLGIFGWFNLPELHEEDDTLEDRSGNFGTLDLIAALQWIQRNIAAFGGDPGNVTIWGESAGGLNVYSLVASPLAKGLFHKAIAQSPITLLSTMAQACNYSDDAEPGHEVSSRELLSKWLMRDGKAAGRAEAKALIANMNPRAIAAYVRGKTPAELLAAITPGALSFYAMPMLFRDGHVLPDMPMHEIFSDRTRYNAVPLIIGTNRDEYKLFMSQNPEYVNLVLGKIPVVNDTERYNRHAAYMSDLWKAVCADSIATQMLASGHCDVWVYRFDWDEQPPVPFIQPRLLLGASHVLEMAFVFRDLEGEFDPFRSNTKNNLAGRKEVSDAMAGYWTALAAHGEPGRGKTGGLKEWQRWSADANAEKLMVFDTSADGGTRMVSEEATVARIEYILSTDPAFEAQERCKLYARMFRWSIFAENGDPARLDAFRNVHCPECRLDDLRPAHWP
jgi:para-nitrobenzyl esterase